VITRAPKSPARSTAASREIHIELIRLHAHAMLRMPWVQSLVFIGVIAVVQPHVPLHEWLPWGIASIGIEGVRAVHAAGLLRQGDRLDPARAHLQCVALAALAGLAIGGGGALFLWHLPIIDQALFAIILYVMPAAGVVVSQSSRYMIGAYAALIFIPSTAAWIDLHPGHMLPGIWLVLVYWAFLTMVAANGEQLLMRSVEIRHERDSLVRDLERKNGEVLDAVEGAEKSAQARARVLAAASHDLRQPLHALAIYSAVLSANPPADTMKELASSIDQIVRSLGSLLHGLLDLSSLSTGHFVPQRRRMLLDKVVGSICAEYERPAIDKGLKLVQRLQPIGVVSDPVVIGRIVRNLLDNAVKYTDEGEVTVEVRLAQAPQAVALLSISDTGRGIPPAEQTRIFEEFYQLDNPGRDRMKGVGLGLAIVQRLCEALGARIDLVSARGDGSTFSVYLSDVVEMPESSAIEGASVIFELVAGRRVYVVDDEIDVVRSMTHLLRIWGAEVLAPDSIDSIDGLFSAHGTPDLLITDLRLGGLENGAALAARLRRAYGEFPVVVLTGDVATNLTADLEQDAFTVAFKPITSEALQAAISAAFEAKSIRPFGVSGRSNSSVPRSMTLPRCQVTAVGPTSADRG
jgi:signal transduction histidine kinase/ActR/RegA family two-component response regulator